MYSRDAFLSADLGEGLSIHINEMYVLIRDVMRLLLQYPQPMPLTKRTILELVQTACDLPVKRWKAFSRLFNTAFATLVKDGYIERYTGNKYVWKRW